MSNSPKTIAILYDCPYPFLQGGGQKRFFKIAQYLLKEGWQIEWFCLKFWEGPNILQHQGITYRSVGKKINLYNKKGKRSLFEALYYGWCISKNVLNLKHSILHAGQWPYFHLFPVWMTNFFRKTIFIIDWWEVWGKEWKHYSGKKAFLGRALENISSKLSNHLVTISELGKKQLFSLRKEHPSICVMHNGIDLSEIKNIPSLENSCFNISYLGRLKDHKNIDLLLEAIAILKQKDFVVTLQIIGTGPEYKTLKFLTQHFNIENQVTFLGHIESDLESYARLKSSQIFVHPSTKEGGGSITTLEANACGLPVIAFKHTSGISPEFINHGQNGYWVDEFSAEHLAEAIQTILSDYNTLAEMSKNSINFVEKFDWQIIGKQYHDYFTQLIKHD